MTKKTRRRFSAEFKEQAVARLAEAGATYSSVAGELELTVGQLKSWHLEQLAAGSEKAIAARQSESAELAQLRKENKRLKEENEVMRKASAFFRTMGGETMTTKGSVAKFFGWSKQALGLDTLNQRAP